MDVYPIYGWAIDFWRAFMQRPKIIRWIVKLIIGKYAWSELIGMKMRFDAEGEEFGSGWYRLEGSAYHKENLNYKNW